MKADKVFIFHVLHEVLSLVSTSLDKVDNMNPDHENLLKVSSSRRGLCC